MYTSAISRRNNYFADNDTAYLTFVNRNDFIIPHYRFTYVALRNVPFLEWKIRERRCLSDRFTTANVFPDPVTRAIIDSVK